MTIKRRLFLSNILMIVIPVVLITVFTLIMSLTVMWTLGEWGEHDFDSDRFNKAISKVEDRFKDFSGDLRALSANIDEMNREYEGTSLSLSIYKDGDALYAQVADSPIADLALNQIGSHILTMDNIALYLQPAGEYTIVLTDTEYAQRDAGDEIFGLHSRVVFVGLLLFALIIIIILLTNTMLTRLMWKRIVTPLDILAQGVHQIRDGNLDFRIDYACKDEFSAVCTDFNEMAQRLCDMVNMRQKDEESRKELIAGISHDLRTPLTSIRAYVEGIEKGVASTPHLEKKYLDTIKSKTEDLEHIINQLFLFSKLDVEEFPIRLEPVDIGDSVNSMLNDFAEEYDKKQLSLEMTDTVQNIYVRADAVWLRSVFINILENSAKYKIKERGRLQVSCIAVGTQVIIRMEDDGPGVSSQSLPKLFDVFYRGDPSRNSRGSGLGLAITAKVINKMGGTVRAENLPESGLAIILSFPIILEVTDEKNTDH